MSHTDFDVVTGPSMPQRPAPSQQHPSPSSEAEAKPVTPTPIDRRANGEQEQR